ncbi:MAG: carbohydrate ABC transporter permease [Chloroflexi bacterium]|nr:carbohydrate ABC transporter permease [Chloroflexota bacterium]
MLGKRAAERLGRIIATGVIALGSLFALFPVFWMLSTSLKPSGDVFLVPPRWVPLHPLWSNYPAALSFMNAAVVFRNSFIVSGLTVIGATASSAAVAYAFARLPVRGSSVLFLLVLSIMMLPGQVTLIPQFLLFKMLGWLDTFKPLVVPSFFGVPYAIFLLRQFFRTIPREMDDAAVIDGCSVYSIFWRIILPLSKPALAVVAIQHFIASWQDFLGPLIYLNSNDRFTVALALAQFQVAYGGTPWQLLMAASTVALLPPIILFFVAQRFFIQGIVISGVKG